MKMQIMILLRVSDRRGRIGETGLQLLFWL